MIGPGQTRRGEEFDALVSGRAPARHGGEYDDLLDVVASLRSVPEVDARPAFVADLRSQLLAAAQQQEVRVVDDATARLLTPKQRRGTRERRLAAVVGGFAVVAATGSMAVASQGALPGEALYPVKRAIENAQTNLAGSDAAKTESLLEHADIRLAEVEALAARENADAAAIAETLDAFNEQTNQAAALALDDYTDGDRAGLEGLRSFNKDSFERLGALDETVPSDSRDALADAAENLSKVEQTAAGQCPECGGADLFSLPDFDPSAFGAKLEDIDLSGIFSPGRGSGSATGQADPTTVDGAGDKAGKSGKKSTSGTSGKSKKTGSAALPDDPDAEEVPELPDESGFLPPAPDTDADTSGGSTGFTTDRRSGPLSKALKAISESLGLEQPESSDGTQTGGLGLLGLLGLKR
ncbi:DUF5667 domain-containing protein [Nocardioides sp. YIM 152588]|uniref:DUF5667 domain-containing protein n=1 Tax=Nocardioides sp. YIM 152588 TaxID=3158259 RepID=UPI0032E3C251